MIRRLVVVTCIAMLSAASTAFAQTIAGGASHTIVLAPDGTVWTFGNNNNGQLGDDTFTTRKVPVQVNGLTDVVAVAAGANHSLAVASNGTLYAWGDNTFRQLGDGTTTDRKTPVAVSLASVQAIAAGEYHSVALTANGDVYAWGTNVNGQLGTGDTSNYAIPTLVMTGGAAVGAGIAHTLVVKTDGTAWAAGWNPYGQLGNGNTTQQTSFVQMSGITTATSAAGGRIHSLILLADGTVKAAGYNGWGALGDGTWTQRTTPVSVGGMTGVTAIAAGFDHSAARTTDGRLWIWGGNASGQLGDASTTTRNSPVEITALTAVGKIGLGHHHSVAVTADGIVYTWGSNTSGQLGSGTTTNRSVPQAISAADYAWKVAPPAFSLPGGTYNATQSVVVTSETPGAIIHYTQDGTEPTEAAASTASGSTIAITASQTLKAKAFKTGLPESDTSASTYTLKPVMPSFSPAATTYTTPQTVSMTTTTVGATIRYTLDGSEPTAGSVEYTGPVTISTTTTLKAVAIKSGWTTSDVRTGTYTMNFGTLPAPSIEPGAGTYESQVSVQMDSAVTGVTIRYTTNGTAPTSSSAIYTAPFSVGATTTVKAKAFHSDYTASAETSRSYTITVAAPLFSPTAGTYDAGQVITLTTPTAGAAIHYTLNGDDPTESAPSLASGGTLVAGHFTLKAKAFKSGATPSGVSAATYSIVGANTVAMLSAGDNHSFGLSSDGVAWGWGKNAWGQVGDGTNTTPRLLSRMVVALSGLKEIDGGTDFSLALTLDGAVYGFGNNANGRLGDGTTTNRISPTPVFGLSIGIVRITAGENHGVAVKQDGSVVAWGRNDWGQIGNGTTSTQQLTPTAVTNLADVTAVSAGWAFTLALTQTGSVYAWGYNGNGRLGDGTTTMRTAPVPVSGLATATGISAGYDHALALLADGTVKAWGRNTSGQLGDGTATDRWQAVTVSGLTGVVALAAGQQHSLVLRGDGTVWAFGSNQYGQLGDGTTTNRSTPAQVSGLADVVAVAAGQLHSLALDSEGVVWAWGRNASGQLGDGLTADRNTPYAMSRPGMTWGLAAPQLSLASGTYPVTKTVTLTVTDPEATIRYTTDGSDPVSTSATIPSGGTLPIEQSVTLKASAWLPGSPTSAVAIGVYVLQPATPVLTPAGAVYTMAQAVTLSSTSPGVTITYTTDGTEPTETSSTYASPLSVTTLTTLRARAFRAGWSPSPIAAGTFTFDYGTLPTPVVSPGSATYLSSVQVTMTGQVGSTVRYTMDGSEPAGNSPVYTSPFTVAAGAIVKAKAFHVDYTTSATRTVQYWTKVAAPNVTPGSGTLTAGTLIAAATTTPGAIVHYTIDGREPTAADPSFSGSAPLYAGAFTLKARAFLPGSEPSDVVTASFALNESVTTGVVAAGASHTVVLRPDGTVTAWGHNGVERRLGAVYCSGLGVYSSDRPITAEVSALEALAATQHATAGVRVDGTVVTWGANNFGQLGHESPATTCASLDNADRPTARVVDGLSDIVAVDGGQHHFLALTATGTVLGWGYNGQGQLGNDTTTDSAVPVVANGLSNVTMMSAGTTHSLAVRADGTVWAWGGNENGQLGIAGGAQHVPAQVLGLSNPIAITAGWGVSYAVKPDGTLWVWGQVNGLVPGVTATTTPVQVPDLTGITAVTTGLAASFALGTDGRVWAWGSNLFGLLGDGTEQSRATPGLVPDLPAIRQIATAAHHVVAIADDGSVWAWGRNEFGQIGDLLAGTDRVRPMLVLQAGAVAPGGVATPAGTLDPSLDRVLFYHTDAIGSVRVVTDVGGAVVQRYDFTPFGFEWNAGSDLETRRFTGQERDQESGLDYFGARHYASGTGRFTTVDPVLAVEQALVDPQRWNRYTYVRDNPFRYVDPDGRAIESIWDAFNVGLGIGSFVSNVRQRAYVSAAVDAIGVVVDAGAAAVPLIPGGASSVIRAWRGLETAGDLGSSGRRLLPFRDADRTNEVNKTLDRIESGGPFVHAKDSVVFRNREGRLPGKNDPEYYREYTVNTPGAKHRGTRRIVRGKGGETYYTDDHYRNFVEIDPRKYPDPEGHR